MKKRRGTWPPASRPLTGDQPLTKKPSRAPSRRSEDASGDWSEEYRDRVRGRAETNDHEWRDFG